MNYESPVPDVPVIIVRALRKAYGSLVAVDGIDLRVERGEIFGLLGHNGAGKSTTVECLVGTKRPDGGTVMVLGMNPRDDRKRLFERVGVQFQTTRYQEKLLVREACGTFARLYARDSDWRVSMRRFRLEGVADSYCNELSGGERQKLAVLLALMHEPELLFLDELTTGLDPAARREIWRFLGELKERGVTIVLTSHYMDEVEYLCDRVAIMSRGRIVLEGSPGDLVAEYGAKNLEDVFLRVAGAEGAAPEVGEAVC